MQKIIHTKNPERGFTLIELLVVIAIIGILSSIIIVNLMTARGKGSDAAVKGDLSAILTQSSIDYPGNSNSYGTNTGTSPIVGGATYAWSGVSGDPNVALLSVAANDTTTVDKTVGRALANAYIHAKGHIVQYTTQGGTFWVQAQLSTGEYWCIDSTGFSGIITTALSSVTATCS